MEDGHSNAGSKDYLVSLMFSHYDLNNNGLLEAQELSKVYYRSSYFFFFHPFYFLSVFPPSAFSISLVALFKWYPPGVPFPKQLRDDWNVGRHSDTILFSSSFFCCCVSPVIVIFLHLFSTLLSSLFYRRLRMNIFLSCPKSVPCRTCWPTMTSITTPISISTSSTPPSASFTVSPFFFSLCCFLFLFTAILMLLFYTFHSTYSQNTEPFVLGNTKHAYI